MLVNPIARDAILLAAIWLGYAAIHSLLASLRLKAWVYRHWPNFMPAYRLTFNFVSIILLAIPAWVLYTGEKIMLWQFNGWLLWLTNGIAVLAMTGFVISLSYYDGQVFLGLRQFRNKEKNIKGQENLKISPFHRYVRHPWYSFALMVIWTRSMDSLMLTSAAALSLYIFLGSRLEEEKLKSDYGNLYENYRCRVPGLIPLPWKYLSQAEADTLRHGHQEQNRMRDNTRHKQDSDSKGKESTP